MFRSQRDNRETKNKMHDKPTTPQTTPKYVPVCTCMISHFRSNWLLILRRFSRAFTSCACVRQNDCRSRQLQQKKKEQNSTRSPHPVPPPIPFDNLMLQRCRLFITRGASTAEQSIRTAPLVRRRLLKSVPSSNDFPPNPSSQHQKYSRQASIAPRPPLFPRKGGEDLQHPLLLHASTQ